MSDDRFHCTVEQVNTEEHSMISRSGKPVDPWSNIFTAATEIVFLASSAKLSIDQGIGPNRLRARMDQRRMVSPLARARTLMKTLRNPLALVGQANPKLLPLAGATRLGRVSLRIKESPMDSAVEFARSYQSMIIVPVMTHACLLLVLFPVVCAVAV
jgi:hypothetical protein